MKYIVGLILIVALVEIHLWVRRKITLRRYNKGICPKCGSHLRHHTTTCYGEEWWICDKCGYETRI